MLVLHVDDELSTKLEQMAAASGISTEACARELLRQAVEEADDLDLALEEHRQGGRTYSSEEVRRELGLAG